MPGLHLVKDSEEAEMGRVTERRELERRYLNLCMGVLGTPLSSLYMRPTRISTAETENPTMVWKTPRFQIGPWVVRKQGRPEE